MKDTGYREIFTKGVSVPQLCYIAHNKIIYNNNCGVRDGIGLENMQPWGHRCAPNGSKTHQEVLLSW